ncbi:hypothetical protein PsalN5692_00227 [Piscirickettsia salmonis]|uniref:hypothetical protein n=2 Tax=Piscirickettsia salmonis TaxID=1238 RepID=UPI0012B9DD97|nr:hypothetical protein [Piscirickettsia salmonis]QGP48822.1 hypothetical protein PsalN5692_00227 [Piscirickettsia salmonis]
MTWFEFLHTLNVAALISLAIFMLRVWLDRKKFYREKSIAELEELQAFFKPCHDFGSYDTNLKFLKAFRTVRKH